MKLRVLLYIAVSIVGISVGARTLFSRYGAEQLSSYIMYPVLVTQQRIITPIKHFFAEKQTIAALHQEVAALTKERDALVAQTVELTALANYSDEIKELLEFKKQYSYEDAILAQVLVCNMSDNGHFFLVDGGQNKGIEKNMIAVYSNGLIGKVEEVYPQYSKVILITDRLCKVAAICATTHTCGIYEGCNDENSAALNRVSHLDTLQEGDLVLSSGQGLVFPRGFALGTIKSHTNDGLTYQVEVEPLFDLAALQYCFILAKK